MAKRKKKDQAAMPMPTTGGGRISVSLDPAENGYVVHASSESSGKTPQYKSQTLVAPNRSAAIRIGTEHLQNCGTKGKKKKGSAKGKRVQTKS